MKKGLKILLGVLILLILLSIVYAILIVKQILPNPFLDTKDLICSRENKFPGYIESEIIIMEFNKDATIKNYKEIYKITYEDIEELKLYKESFDSLNKEYQYDENDKSISTEDFVQVDDINGYYKKTKKEMKNIMLNDLYFSLCE